MSDYIKEIKQLEKIKTDALMYSISKDETRLMLNGVCHENKKEALVSTDGHRLTCLRSRYESELGGKIINPKTFELIPRDYPNVSAVIPNPLKLKHFWVTFEKHHFARPINHKPVKVFIGLDNDAPREGGFPMASVSFEDNFQKSVCVNAENLKPLAGKGRPFLMAYNGELAPMLFALAPSDCIEIDKAFFDFYLVMPMKK